jgi:hypothetical protein
MLVKTDEASALLRLQIDRDLAFLRPLNQTIVQLHRLIVAVTLEIDLHTVAQAFDPDPHAAAKAGYALPATLHGRIALLHHIPTLLRKSLIQAMSGA